MACTSAASVRLVGVAPLIVCMSKPREAEIVCSIWRLDVKNDCSHKRAILLI